MARRGRGHNGHVIDEAELRLMSPAERRELASRLEALEHGEHAAHGEPSEHGEHGRLRGERRLALLLLSGCCVILAGWTVVLAATLQHHFEIQRWRGVWVGFDIFLTIAFVLAARAAWRERLVLIPLLMVVGTMLCCDAWFDVETSLSVTSIASAVFVELPLAFLAFAGARRLLIATATAGGARPRLWLRDMPLAGAGLDEALPRLRRNGSPPA